MLEMKPLLIALCAKFLAQTSIGSAFLDETTAIEFKEVNIEDPRKPQRSREAIAPRYKVGGRPQNEETPVKLSNKTPDCHNK